MREEGRVEGRRGEDERGVRGEEEREGRGEEECEYVFDGTGTREPANHP